MWKNARLKTVLCDLSTSVNNQISGFRKIWPTHYGLSHWPTKLCYRILQVSGTMHLPGHCFKDWNSKNNDFIDTNVKFQRLE